MNELKATGEVVIAKPP